jgi:hypothetical protein
MLSRIVAAVLLFVPMVTLAQAPPLLGYQGRLLKLDGTPEAGTAQMRFSVFSAETGGSSLWEESQAVSITQGFYSTYLGRITSFPAGVFDTTALWLEVAVQAPGDTQFRTMTPRQRVGSVAYALSAKSVNGGPVNATSVSVNGTQVIDSTGKLTSSAGYSAGSGISIDGTTRAISMNSSGCSTGQVLQWTGTLWQCATLGSGSGGISGVTGTAPISITNGTTAPIVSVAVGTTGGTVAAGDDSRFGRVGTVAVSSTAPTNGQVLQFNGTQWAPAATGTGGISSVTAGTGLTGGTITTSGTIGIAPSGVGSAQLAPGAVTFDKLSGTGCTANQVLRFNGTTWACATASGGNSAPPSLVANFEFEETGNTFNDSSGLGNNATFASGLTAGAIGQTGTGANFSGGFASVGAGNSIPDTVQVLVEAYIWPQSVAMSGNGVIASKSGAWSLRYQAGSSVSDIDFTVTTRGSPANCTVATTGAAIRTTGWTHVSGFYDGLTVAVAINGVVFARADCAKGSVAANAGTVLNIGGTAAGERYLGFLDSLRIRSFAQIPTTNRFVYTQWGPSSCTNGATTLMQGIGTTTYYTYSDAEPSCLPRTGTTGPTNTNPGAYGNLLYDMQLAGTRPPGVTTPTLYPKVNCAVCAAPRPHCVQMKGVAACPAGFVTQYSGYLYSNYYTYGGITPICLDTDNLDTSAGTAPDQGGYIYPVINQGTRTSVLTSPNTQFVRCALCCLP